jgi:RNA polymerase sigma-70 factor (ECF subfamily)
MQLVQAGNQDAYGTLFARYRGPVWSWLLRRTRDRDLTSDLYQEVFLRVWKSAHTFHLGQPVKPWIFRIAANVSRDAYRKTQRTIETVELDTARAPSAATDPLSGHDLERAVAQLSDSLREAFLLGAVHGMDHNEVAVALNISPANARARVSRARTKLRKILSGWGVER